MLTVGLAKGAISMSVVDSAMTREVLRDISKRPIDISNLNVYVNRGVVHLAGRVDNLRGEYRDLDLREEMNIIVRILKQKPGIRDVCCEIDFVEIQMPGKLNKLRRKRWY